MKKGVLFLALLLVVSLGGCERDGDITDTITVGTWRVSYFIAAGDEHTGLFNGYVFTFNLDGTVNVTRPGLPPAQGTWNEHADNSRFDLDFDSFPGLLDKLDEDWVVDDIRDDELLLHEPGAPLNLFEMHKI